MMEQRDASHNEVLLEAVVGWVSGTSPHAGGSEPDQRGPECERCHPASGCPTSGRRTWRRHKDRLNSGGFRGHGHGGGRDRSWPNHGYNGAAAVGCDESADDTSSRYPGPSDEPAHGRGVGWWWVWVSRFGLIFRVG